MAAFLFASLSISMMDNSITTRLNHLDGNFLLTSFTEKQAPQNYMLGGGGVQAKPCKGFLKEYPFIPTIPLESWMSLGTLFGA